MPGIHEKTFIYYPSFCAIIDQIKLIALIDFSTFHYRVYMYWRLGGIYTHHCYRLSTFIRLWLWLQFLWGNLIKIQKGDAKMKQFFFFLLGTHRFSSCECNHRLLDSSSQGSSPQSTQESLFNLHKPKWYLFLDSRSNFLP